MEYLILGTIFLTLAFIILQTVKGRRKKAEIEQIRMEWGKPKSKNVAFDFVRISKYAEIVKEKFHRLTDQTIEDMDFHKIFMFIDRTTSKVGQQFLYKKVIEPINNIENANDKLDELFTSNKDLRESVQQQLLKLSNNDAYTISSLLHDTLLAKPKWVKYLIVDIIVILSLIILSFKFPVLLIALIFPIGLNIYLHLWNRSNAFHYSWSIPQLYHLTKVSKSLLKHGNLLYDQNVANSVLQLTFLERKAKLIRFKPSGFDINLGQSLLDIIRAIFLIEVFMIFKISKELFDKRDSIKILFNYVGNIDASISVASLRAGKIKTCIPILISQKKVLDAKNIYHPLVRDCVPNSLSVSNKSILITGSNMSGKSTFLRTLAINSILAQTIYTCFADEYTSPIVKQFSSIRIDDNLFEGKSYYFEEVNVMASLIKEVDLPHQNLFFLDELFKGTNTVERISSAKAILSYLNQNDNIVIISTHDIELANMLKEEYDLYHFTENVDNNKLHFDHIIKQGQIKTRNAIRILEMSNYPTEIVNEAQQLSLKLGNVKFKA